MPLNLLKLAFNRQAPNTLAPVGGFATAFPPLFQFDVKDLIVQIFDPGVASFTGTSFVPVDYTGDVMRVTMSTQPMGNAAPTILAFNDNLVWNPAGAGNSAITGNNAGYFSGSLALNLAALTTFIGAAASAQPWLEFAIRDGGVTKPFWQVQVTVLAVADQGQVVNAGAPSLYLTVAEAQAAFLAKAGTTSDQKIMLNPDGTKAVIFSLGNNGAIQFTPLVPAPAPVY
jgi:hypothetical protein